MSVASDPGVEAAVTEEEELIEKPIREKFKRMCSGYYDSVVKKLTREHEVCSRLAEKFEDKVVDTIALFGPA